MQSQKHNKQTKVPLSKNLTIRRIQNNSWK